MSKKDNGPWYYLKRSDGKKSLSATIVLLPMWIIMVIYILSAFDNLGFIKMKEFNVEAAGLILSATLVNYWGRRHTESKTEVALNKRQPNQQLPPNHEEEGGD